MKKQIATTVATLSLFLALAAIGFAGLGTKLVANVPFDFTVNGKTLAAGKYAVTNGSTANTVIIRNEETGSAAGTIVRTEDSKKTGKAQLIFRRYGNQYFLATVTDGNRVQELPMTKAERKAARGGDNLAGKETKPEIVRINAAVGQ